MVKTLNNLLLQNQWTDCSETWYVVFETQAHHSLYDPGLTLIYFTPRSNLVAETFVMEKVKTIFFGTITDYDLKVSICIELKE